MIALVVLLALLPGCGSGGPQMAPVSGTATIDGKPLAEAGVLFTPQAGGRPASGTTDAQGNFTLTTKTPNDGAIVGTNLVSVSKVLFVSGSNATGLPNPSAKVMPKSLIPTKYADGKTSGLVVEVAAGMEPVKLELSSR